ncbi:MAG: metallophosphoesterase [Saprospiraceae bacterium]|nr:metallophosphoesterase [Saprospiraceae bacterium]
MKNSIILLAGCYLLLFAACGTGSEPLQRILFLGHPYQWHADGKRIDYRVEATDRNQFDKLWLGGDLCAKATAELSTLQYLDSLLDLGSPSVHWSLGNHDIQFGHLDWIKAATGRPNFYQSWEDGYTLLVLNTNIFTWYNASPADSLCTEMANQIRMIQAVCDTISQSSHLVILHHQCLLTDELSGGETDLARVFNYYQPDFKVLCTPDTATFTAVIYPALQRVQQRGVQVVLVGGDMGMRAKKFEYQTPDGIWFLGAGINNSVPDDFRPEYITNFEPDQVLLFKYSQGQLSWQFEDLNTISKIKGPSR